MSQRPPADYLERRQPHIQPKSREFLVDYLTETHAELRLHAESLFVTVFLLDSYLDRHEPVEARKLELVGITAMFLAAKYEESGTQLPCLLLLDTARNVASGGVGLVGCTRQDVFKMEADILSTVGFRLTAPSPLAFLHRLAHAACVQGTRTEFLAQYLLELALAEASTLAFRPSTLSAAAIHLALHATGQPWEAEYAQLIGVGHEAMMTCGRALVALHRRARGNRDKFVWVKWLKEKRGAVSGIDIVSPGGHLDSTRCTR